MSTAPTANTDAHAMPRPSSMTAALAQARASPLPARVGTSPIITGPVAYSSAPSRTTTTLRKMSASSASPVAPISPRSMSCQPPRATPADGVLHQALQPGGDRRDRQDRVGHLVSQRGRLRPPVRVADDHHAGGQHPQHRDPDRVAVADQRPRGRVDQCERCGGDAQPREHVAQRVDPGKPVRVAAARSGDLPGVVGDGDQPAHDLQPLGDPRVRDQHVHQRGDRGQDELGGQADRPRERPQHRVADAGEHAAGQPTQRPQDVRAHDRRVSRGDRTGGQQAARQRP